MSLSGLDSPHVQDAYQTAVAEAGGWFLLRYTSRDSVDLLARGKNGVSEARNAITAYPEPSPLYGLMMYRRRRILIKYIPGGTSRLLQARTTVHFQDVLERYSPYETLVEIDNAAALNDTSLAASFQLHTASPSPSTSRLDEIREDGEDGGAALGAHLGADRSAGSTTNAKKYRESRRIELSKRKTERAASPLNVPAETALSPASVYPPTPASPLPPPPKHSVSQFLVREESGHTSITPLDTSFSGATVSEYSTSDISDKTGETAQRNNRPGEFASSTTQDATESIHESTAPTSPGNTDERPNTAADFRRERELPAEPTGQSSDLGQSANMVKHMIKPLEDDPYDLSRFDELFKPKVKLAPRPVAAAEMTKRPSVARVSAVPASFRPATRKQERPRPRSQGQGNIVPAVSATSGPTMSFAHSPPPIPEVPEYKPRPISRGSVKSAPAHKSSSMTPDKLRLMKAVELRRKQLRKSQEQPLRPAMDTDLPEVPKLPEVPRRNPLRDVQTVSNPEPKVEAAEQTTDDENQPQSSKADSGIEIHYGKLDDHETQEPGDGLDEPMPTLPETEASTPNQALTGGDAPPPVVSEVYANATNTMGAPSVDVAPYAGSSTESQTPTESTVVPEPASEENTPGPAIVTPDGSRRMTSDVQATASTTAPTTGPTPRPLSQASSTSESSGISPDAFPMQQTHDLTERRRGLVEPLRIEIHSGNPDDFISDDDEFLDELHSATVYEAKPINISRSPMAPAFPGRRPSADATSVRAVNITRSASTPNERTVDTPVPLSPEPANALFLGSSPTPPPEKYDPVTGMARNVSSGISKRIQALAEMSTREAALSAHNLQSRPLTPETIPNGFLQQERKTAAKTPARSRPTSFRRQSSRASQSPHPPPVTENAPTWSVQHDSVTNRNSVSVTARIVRPVVINELEQDQAQLHQSDLRINHHRDVRELPPLNTAVVQSETSSPAMSPVLSRSSTEVRTLHSAGRFGRSKQPASPAGPALDDFPPPPTNRHISSVNAENAAVKDSTRTSRFFKRMSSITGPKRRSAASKADANTASLGINEAIHSPTMTMQRASVVSERADTPPAVVVGDLNVQFPDSLLWKRRIVTIDETGNLQFAIAQAMEIHKGVALKKYPLLEFKMPFAPDLDYQELSHSVVLEFHDGTSLQAACEDAMTQRQVLQLLKTYWTAWTAVI